MQDLGIGLMLVKTVLFLNLNTNLSPKGNL
jgi:hypothetical protein